MITGVLTHVRRKLFCSVSAACVRAAKATHPQLPSSFQTGSLTGDSRFGVTGGKSVMNTRTILCDQKNRTKKPRSLNGFRFFYVHFSSGKKISEDWGKDGKPAFRWKQEHMKKGVDILETVGLSMMCDNVRKRKESLFG